MLSVSGPERFYYLRNFHDLCCKYTRVLSVIRQLMDREPQADEAYIMISKDCHTVRLYSYDKRSCRLYEQCYDKVYTFMKVSCGGPGSVLHKLGRRGRTARLDCHQDIKNQINMLYIV